MATTIVVDPVSRIEGHLKIEVTVDDVAGSPEVVDAHVTGTLFRGFEKLLIGRDPRDAQHITQRICGVCPVSHAMAASKALDAAFAVQIPANARVLRNLVLGANFVQSHILHFYHLALMDFVAGPNMPPWRPRWNVDLRFDQATSDLLIDHYLQALDMRRKAHEMGAIYGGKLPHTPTYLPGGITALPSTVNIAQFQAYVNELANFVDTVYIADVETLASEYSDYYSIGAGHGHLLAFGVFDEDAAGTNKLFPRGRLAAGSSTVLPVDTAVIAEEVSASWYDAPAGGQHPASGTTEPIYPKTGAYSWLKAPRYDDLPHECGPLARMRVSGDYTGGVSVIDRHRARAYETQIIMGALDRWLDELAVGGDVYEDCTVPTAGSAEGLTEAPRGALGHWLAISGGTISGYQVITPTCWNSSPRDERDVLGPLEQALLGTPVQDSAEPIELLRVVHSFDPCLACAVHVFRPSATTPVTRIMTR